MLDDVLEIVLELVLDGAIELASCKKVPLPLRILFGGVLLALFLGLFGLLLAIGIRSREPVMVGIAILLLVCMTVLVWRKYKEMRK